MSPGTAIWWKRPITWIATAVVVVAIGVLIAVNTHTGWPAAGSPTPPVPASPGATPSVSPSADELTAETPYCEAFRTIIAGGSESNPDDGETIDLKALSAKYAEYLKKYRQAAALAPESLQDDYQTVIGFLEEAKDVVDSGDFDRIKTIFKVLPTLNETMAAIDQESRRICA